MDAQARRPQQAVEQQGPAAHRELPLPGVEHGHVVAQGGPLLDLDRVELGEAPGPAGAGRREQQRGHGARGQGQVLGEGGVEHEHVALGGAQAGHEARAAVEPHESRQPVERAARVLGGGQGHAEDLVEGEAQVAQGALQHEGAAVELEDHAGHAVEAAVVPAAPEPVVELVGLEGQQPVHRAVHRGQQALEVVEAHGHGHAAVQLEEQALVVAAREAPAQAVAGAGTAVGGGQEEEVARVAGRVHGGRGPGVGGPGEEGAVGQGPLTGRGAQDEVLARTREDAVLDGAVHPLDPQDRPLSGLRGGPGARRRAGGRQQEGRQGQGRGPGQRRGQGRGALRGAGHGRPPGSGAGPAAGYAIVAAPPRVAGGAMPR